MTRKLAQGVVVSSVVTLLPAAGNLGALSYPQLWLLCGLGVVATVLQPAYSPFAKGTGPQWDRGTAAVVIWSVYLVSAAAVLEAVYWRYPGSLAIDAVAVLAFAITVAGLALRSWAIATLGADFTWHISYHPGQRLVERGPYRFLRHPGYAGALLTYCAGPIFLHAWLAASLAFVVLPVVFLARIRIEEGVLMTRMGADYQAYRARVRALLPWVW